MTNSRMTNDECPGARRSAIAPIWCCGFVWGFFVCAVGIMACWFWRQVG